MISPSDLWKRAGGSGCGRLVPFFKAVLLYAVVGGADGQGGGLRAACKAAPVLCLAAATWAQRAHACPSQRALCSWVAAGLALSALGDVLLEWPAGFEPGMLAFALAQAAYWRAWGAQGALCGRALLAAAAVGYGLWLHAPGRLGLLVPLYALGLALSGGRAMARAHCMAGHWQRAAGAAGAALFLLSDALLSYSMFVSPLPQRALLVMGTYYAAQLCIALTAFEAPVLHDITSKESPCPHLR